ncbi:mannitol dehydrogenase family protein [Marinilactibacillus psychrotolerans]|uniref:Mannitol dehydrogenase family protein n=1 Tax=Marinilactibacillus psychrotolerans TaxID=191770 RepID=A0A5R9C8D7_9LACT|nr:mannitol dehydrogenase family protein [Marinilactibacillus psychrotolerans]TLQ09597.1 mannitol dehydrogenase family protein [Marinilactibacillus psychrotolerans]
MIQLEKHWLEQKKAYESLGVKIPKAKVGTGTPQWIHFGGGNLYRAMHAQIAQDLIDKHQLENGVVVVETFDEEVPEKAYQAYENQILQVVMKEDGQLQNRLLEATQKAIYGNPQNTGEWNRLVDYFESPILEFVTLTITEKGYGLKKSDGSLLPVIEKDMSEGPGSPSHTMSIIASLLYKRYQSNQLPIAMVTTDNFSRNGEVFRKSILTIAESWMNKRLVAEGFLAYLKDTSKVTFPWSMIDRITPNPSEDVLNVLKEKGFEDLKLIRTSKGTNIAPFVNTEEIHYLVVEDAFPNGRPDLTRGGILLTDRETVDKADVMKVTTCLNPLHTALAVYGCLLNFDSIAKEVQDTELQKLVQKIGYQEGLPVVVDPEVINPKEFIDEVVNKRLPNPYIPDTPQRIASDTSQKIAIRYGETIKKYNDSTDHSVEELTFIPLVLAGWLRYLMAVDDNGDSFVPSPDPLLDELQEALKDLQLGNLPANLEEILHPILANQNIFGVDLFEIKLADKVIGYFKELTQGKGSVRTTLKKYLA